MNNNFYLTPHSSSQTTLTGKPGTLRARYALDFYLKTFIKHGCRTNVIALLYMLVKFFKYNRLLLERQNTSVNYKNPGFNINIYKYIAQIFSKVPLPLALAYTKKRGKTTVIPQPTTFTEAYRASEIFFKQYLKTQLKNAPNLHFKFDYLIKQLQQISDEPLTADLVKYKETLYKTVSITNSKLIQNTYWKRKQGALSNK